MKDLFIDIETYSSVDITVSGAYKYCQSFDFEILMVAYAFDQEPVQIIDLMQGGTYPKLFLDALFDPGVTKHAHNANFERNAFKTMGFDIPTWEWECTAVRSAYCGLPLSLDGVSQALDLGDKAKLASGKDLIRFFSCPVKPTKTNGMRYRNFPHHDLEKWEQFKQYCMQDVEAEREIHRLLAKYPLPIREKRMYLYDQNINDRGLLVDLDLARKAVELDEEHSQVLTAKMQSLTGLDNPNSPSQLKKYLSEKLGKDVESLAKGGIEDLIDLTNDPQVKLVLKLRQMASKTSVKKYTAMVNCAGDDNRVRGLFQFYGANRTGRWAGRLVQMQNLPQNHLDNLEGVREKVKTLPYKALAEEFPNVSDVLSQLVRTTFIAPEGKTFAVADFSAIEARVIAWLASEKWRIDVFKSHGKIYEASASMMFNVPIEQVTKGSDLRAKGKVAELALGYQGGVGALKNMGGESMGLNESEMQAIVNLWRNSNPCITGMWQAVNSAAIKAVQTKKEQRLSEYRDLCFNFDGQVFTIRLPSGRQLFYQKAILAQNQFGSACIKYKGMDQVTKKWGWVDTYGGKLVENIVQAIARDLLSDSISRLCNLGENYEVVMHVHDEVVLEVPSENSETYLEKICDLMGQEVAWARGLPLKADGYVTNFYKKD